ncbi:MAG TPA: hypothetical protein VNT53_10690 [Pseudolysinimonas sp.]|nr:hypothetical protein [Pseudolysinimonas sp.]
MRDNEVAPRRGLVSPGAEISDDTHVGSSTPVRHPEVHRSPANPDALVEGQQVGDGTELE